MLIREAKKAEHGIICRQLAGMKPWSSLNGSYTALLQALQSDKLREAWVAELTDAELPGCVFFRRRDGYEYASQRGFSACLHSLLGTSENTPPEYWPKCGYVNVLAVFHEHQGQGIGKALLQYAEKISAVNCAHMLLSVTESKVHALKFYERQNYRCIGKHVDAEDRDSRKLLMVKSLSPCVRPDVFLLDKDQESFQNYGDPGDG